VRRHEQGGAILQKGGGTRVGLRRIAPLSTWMQGGRATAKHTMERVRAEDKGGGRNGFRSRNGGERRRLAIVFRDLSHCGRPTGNEKD